MRTRKHKSQKRNPKVVILSLVALICFYLTFAYDWLWIVPVLIIIYINQKELFKKN